MLHPLHRVSYGIPGIFSESQKNQSMIGVRFTTRISKTGRIPFGECTSYSPFRRLFSETPAVKGSEQVQEASSETQIKKPLTFTRFMLYAVGVSTTSFFFYNLYQAEGNLHKTEILIGARLAKLPFYYPPGPPISERNASLPFTPELPSQVVEELSAWFIHQDSAAKDGLTRADILDLFGEGLGLVDNDKPESSFSDESLRKALVTAVDQFIERGKGRLTEYKRQSGVSIQETLELLNDLVSIHKQHSQDTASLMERVSSTVHEEVVKLADRIMPIVSTALLPEIGDVNEREEMEMELCQLERSRDSLLKNRPESALSEAEAERLLSVKTQIAELERLILEL